MFIPEEGLISNLDFLKRLRPYETVTTNKKIKYANIPAAFDIETSSFYIHGEKRATSRCFPTSFLLNYICYAGRGPFYISLHWQQIPVFAMVIL